MSYFLSNLPHPLSSRVPCSPGAASDKEPLVSFSSPTMVPTPAAAVNPLPNVVGSLVPAPSHSHSVNKDPVTSIEPFESAPRVDKGKQPTDEDSQCKGSRL